MWELSNSQVIQPDIALFLILIRGQQKTVHHNILSAPKTALPSYFSEATFEKFQSV